MKNDKELYISLIPEILTIALTLPKTQFPEIEVYETVSKMNRLLQKAESFWNVFLTKQAKAKLKNTNFDLNSLCNSLIANLPDYAIAYVKSITNA